MVLKPRIKKPLKKVEEKPKLKKVVKPFPLNPNKIEPNLSCEWKNNFPYKPEMKEYECISTEEELKWLASEMSSILAFAFDTETNTLRTLSDNADFRFVGMSVSWGEDNTYYIPVGHVRDEDLDRQLTLDIVVKYMKRVFDRTNVRIYGWNLKFDFHVLRRIRINVKTRDIFDGMLASWLCDENTPNGLKENSAMKLHVSQEHFKEATETVPKEVKKQFGFKPNAKCTFDLVLIDDALPYVCGDAFYTWCNCLGFEKELVEQGMDTIYYNMYVPFLFVLLEMEEQGVDVDLERLKEMGVEMQKDLDELQYKIYELAGVEFNIGSSQQKAEILFGWRKPDIPVTSGVVNGKEKKPSKEVVAILNTLKSGKINESEARALLEKKGFYADEKGKIWKRANVNEEILKHAFNFPVMGETDTGNPSTDGDTIWRISRKTYTNKMHKRKAQGVEMCKYMLEYSKISKLKTAFVDGILEQLYEDGKAHPSFNQIGCVEGSTLIPTGEGLVPIKSLSDNWIDGERIPFNTHIVNRYSVLEPTSHAVQFKDVPTVKVKTALGIEIECSEIHPLLCNQYTSTEYYNNLDGCRKYFYDEDSKSWVKASEIDCDRYVFVPVGYNVFSTTYPEFSVEEVVYNANSKKSTIPTKMDTNLAEFLGIYYADGSIHDNNGSFSIRITNSNQKVIDRVSYLSETLFNIIPTYEVLDWNIKSTCITAKSLSQIEKLYEMKRGCVNKVIPECILKSPRDCIVAFLKGLTLDSAPIVEKDKVYLKMTVSNSISAKYIQSILFNLGIVSSVRQDKSKTDNVYHISIYNQEYAKFCDVVGFVEDKEVFTGKDLTHSVNSGYLSTNGGIYVKVKSVESSVNTVYDFSVPDTHSFISGCFVSHNTDSGRLSCSKPNLQQLPKAEEGDKYQIRSVFIGGKYVADAYTGEYIADLKDYEEPIDEDKVYVDRKHIIAIDYHNLEMVCLTHFSGDKNLTEMFANDDDAHGSTAVNMFNLDCTPVECKKAYPHLRQAAKTINFLLMYGGGAALLYENLKNDHFSPVDLGDKSYLESYHCKNGKQVAQAFIDKYFESYAGVAKFIRSQKKFAHRNGYVLTILGRKRRLPDINSNDGEKMSYSERLSVNSAIQGTAGDITINAQIRVSKEKRLEELGCKMLIQVHDELVFECPEQNMDEAIKIIKYDMEHPFGDSESRMVKFLRADEGTGLSYQEAK